MLAHTLSKDHYSSTYYRGATPQEGSGARAEVRKATRAADRQAPAINSLVVVRSPNEPHQDVATRAHLIARDTPVSRTVLLDSDAPYWKRFVQAISKFGSRLSGVGTDIYARVLRVSWPADPGRVETRSGADVVAEGNKSDLVVVGRRRAFPWVLAPLALYVRRLLRKSRTPALVVGSTPDDAYRNVVIATDLETDVGPALKWAEHVAPEASLTFLHVYRGLFESKLQYAGVPHRDILAHRQAAQRKASSGMTKLLKRHRSIQRAVLAHGSAVHDVIRKARELGADLIVVVKSTHSWWAEALGASVSVEIATHADRDVLVVHGASNGTSGTRSAAAERRAQ